MADVDELVAEQDASADPGWLYAVVAPEMRPWDHEAEGWGAPVHRVKIGGTTTRNRLGGLQCGSPVILGLWDELWVLDWRRAESEAHALLANARLHGEWFDMKDEAVHWWLEWLRCAAASPPQGARP